MIYALAVIAVLLLLALVGGAVTGRIRVRSCCAAADPTKDLRMRAAFEDDLVHVDGNGRRSSPETATEMETRPLLTGDTTTTGH